MSDVYEHSHSDEIWESNHFLDFCESSWQWAAAMALRQRYGSDDTGDIRELALRCVRHGELTVTAEAALPHLVAFVLAETRKDWDQRRAACVAKRDAEIEEYRKLSLTEHLAASEIDALCDEAWERCEAHCQFHVDSDATDAYVYYCRLTPSRDTREGDRRGDEADAEAEKNLRATIKLMAAQKPRSEALA